MARFLDRWLGRASGIWTFLAPLAPGGLGGVVTVLTAALSPAVDLINQWGWFGWWCAFIAGGVAIQSLAVLYSMFRVRMNNAKAFANWEKAVDKVNPLRIVFENERLSFRDLSHPITKRINHKTFNGCELFGPINLVMTNSNASGTGFSDCELVVVKDNVGIRNVAILDHCHLVNCTIWNATIFLNQAEFDNMKAALPAIESLSYEKP